MQYRISFSILPLLVALEDRHESYLQVLRRLTADLYLVADNFISPLASDIWERIIELHSATLEKVELNYQVALTGGQQKPTDEARYSRWTEKCQC